MILQDSEDDDAAEGTKKKLPLNDKCLYNTLTCVGKIFTKIPEIFTASDDYQVKTNDFLGNFFKSRQKLTESVCQSELG